MKVETPLITTSTSKSIFDIFYRQTKLITSFLILISTLCSFLQSNAQTQYKYDAIGSGVPWVDDRGMTVSAHGANIIKDNEQYYLFGEAHTDTSNAFVGFNCYSSKDLYNWKFESVALPVQINGKLGPDRVGERPKVMKCPATGEYIMYMHVDNLGYVDQFVGYATSTSITGPYTFKGPLLFEGMPIRKWDMGAFQDKDGSGYILLHGGDIYKLSDDYKYITNHVHKANISGFESPVIFRKGDLYYFLGSHLTSWERNDNDYYTAKSLSGPWTFGGIFAPKGTLTWNSQSTFVLPVEGTKDTTFMFMGDRWAYPKQASAATYVWQPLTIDGSNLSIPEFWDTWKINTTTGVSSQISVDGIPVENTNVNQISYSGQWKSSVDSLTLTSSDKKGDSFSIKFEGRQIGLYALSRPEGGYAKITLSKGDGSLVMSSIVDMYSKYPISSLKFLSPVLNKGKYVMTVTVLGEHGNWTDKKHTLFGSNGNFVSLDKLIISR